MTSPKTQEIIEALSNDGGERIIAATYTWAFKSRAHVSAAFRIAIQRGIIEVAYQGSMGNPVYRRADTWTIK